MFEHYTFGTRARPTGSQNEQEHLVPPESTGHVARGEQQNQCPSPPLSATSRLPSMDSTSDSKPTPENSVDSLAQVLSEQNLRLDDDHRFVRRQSQLSSPSISPQLPAMSMSPTHICPDLQIDDEPQPGYGDLHSLRHFPTSRASLTRRFEADERLTLSNNMRLRRQHSSHFNNNPSNLRTIYDLVEGMIATGEQCNVRTAAPPAPSTPSSATDNTTTRLAPILEPRLSSRMDLDADFVQLEVDEAYLTGGQPQDDKEELSLLEKALSLRRAGTPGGIRKLGPLQYRGSADTALRCANVVRSRPRMRKRKKTGAFSSRGSSVVSSSFPSPVIPPSRPTSELSMGPPPRPL